MDTFDRPALRRSARIAAQRAAAQGIMIPDLRAAVCRTDATDGTAATQVPLEIAIRNLIDREPPGSALRVILAEMADAFALDVPPKE